METPTPAPSAPQISSPAPTGELLDIDALAASARERAKTTYPMRYLGRQWSVITAVPFGRLVETLTGEIEMDSVLTAIECFIVPEQREDFRAAVMASEDATMAELQILSRALNERATQEVGNDAS